MVVVNDIEVRLVSADGKRPFKEHKKGTNTFVEVEPYAEYLLSVRRVGESVRNTLKCLFSVDGKDLGWYKNFPLGCDSSPEFIGIYSESDGFSFQKALRFAKAPFIVDRSITNVRSTLAGIERVKVTVFELIHDGYAERACTEHEDQHSSKTQPKKSPFAAIPSIAVDIKTAEALKKNIRSTEGSHLYGTGIMLQQKKRSNAKVGGIKFNSVKRTKIREKFKEVRLYTIILHYCAAPGLVAVGVLPKPPFCWKHARMNFPQQLTRKEEKKLEKVNVISVKRNRKGNEIIELGDNDNG
jgi:hypothetical protein